MTYGVAMAHDGSRVPNLVAPSSSKGLSVLRALIFGAELSLYNYGWLGVERRGGRVWKAVYPVIPPIGVVDDFVVEWMLEDGFVREQERGSKVVPTNRGRKFVQTIDGAVMSSGGPPFAVRADNLCGMAYAINAIFPEHDHFVRGQMVAQGIICGLLGEDWFVNHVASKSPPTNFFRNAESDDNAVSVGGLRVIHLAEMLWNLRNIAGMDACLALIRSGKVADGFAELEVGKLLFVFGKQFRMVDPSGVLGADYDLEIEFDGVTACADTKCKLETTSLSDKTIMNSLHQARKQLPPNQPGIIFVSVPQVWHDADGDDFGRRLRGVAKSFLRQTRRIVSVKYHTSLIVDNGTDVAPVIGLLEVVNEGHKFSTTVEWNFYREYDGTPEGWTSILRLCSDQEPK